MSKFSQETWEHSEDFAMSMCCPIRVLTFSITISSSLQPSRSYDSITGPRPSRAPWGHAWRRSVNRCEPGTLWNTRQNRLLIIPFTIPKYTCITHVLHWHLQSWFSYCACFCVLEAAYQYSSNALLLAWSFFNNCPFLFQSFCLLLNYPNTTEGMNSGKSTI